MFLVYSQLFLIGYFCAKSVILFKAGIGQGTLMDMLWVNPQKSRDQDVPNCTVQLWICS